LDPATVFPWFLRTLLAAALVLWVFPGLPLWTPVRFFVAAAALLLLPGAEIARRLAGGARHAEILVAGFGIQLLLVALVTVATFQTEWNARGASAFFLLSALATTIATAIWRARPRIDTTTFQPGASLRTVGTILALLVAAAAVGLYFVGVPFEGFYGEDFLALGYIRKLAALEAIRPDNYMYKTPATLAYVYAPFHFWEAMIVSLSGLDPIVIYHRIRALWFIASILIHVVLIGALCGRPRTARLGGIVLVLLTASTFGGVAYAWGLTVESGQLAPLSHPADIAISILAPLELTLAVALVLGESGPWQRMLAWLAPLVPCAVFLIHPREVLQYLIYVSLLGAAVALSGQLSRPRMFRIGMLVAVPLLFASVVGSTIMQTADVNAFEGVAMRQWHQRYGYVLTSASAALFGPPIWEIGGQSTDFPILWKLPGYALFTWLAPIGLAFRRSAAALWLALACLGFLALLRIPALSYLFVSATFSQALFSGEVYLYPMVYTLIALVIALGAEEAVVRWGVAGIGAAFGLGVALAVLATLAMRAGQRGADVLLAGALISATAALAARWMAKGLRSLPSPADRGRDMWTVVATVAATVPLALLGTGFRGHLIDSEDQIEAHHQSGNERPTLFEFAHNQYLRTWVEATDWTRRFDRTFSPGLFTIPPAIMGTLATLPGPAVVDGPFADTWLVEVHLFTAHYLVHSGTPYMLDQAYRAKYMGAEEPHPVFCGAEEFNAERALRYLAENNVRYLLLDPPHTFVSKALASSVRPLLVDDVSGWSILEINVSR